MIDYEYIDFPVHILSFSGYKQPANKNFIKISSRTPVWEYPESVVIKARGGRSSCYAKSFDCYGILRKENPYNTGNTFISSKLIVRAFYSDHDGKWFYSFNGYGPCDLVDKMELVKRFVTEYASNFKI